jgi:hypothetical protein
VLERRILDHDVAVLVAPGLESQGLLVAFTERAGGVSDGPFRGLNLGLKSGDDPAMVMENRRRLILALGIPEFACPRQAHSANIAQVSPESAGKGFADPAEAFPATDALVTSSPGVPIAVLAADCIPVAIADPSSGKVAVIHAGWRGVAAGMVRVALGQFADPSRTEAVVGPGVGPDHYEVGEDVAAAVSAGSAGGAVTRREGERLLLDLPGTVARTLENLGVKRVERADQCTACQSDRFFSYRRDGRTGRQALIAARLA